VLKIWIKSVYLSFNADSDVRKKYTKKLLTVFIIINSTADILILKLIVGRYVSDPERA
jgi:hypothetical protein